MSRVPASQKYANYDIEILDEPSCRDVWYEERGPKVLRVHFRVFRMPSKQKFTIRHMANATDSDRQEVERLLPAIPRMFANWELDGLVKKQRHSTQSYYFFWVSAGTIVEDPLVQLELEMMLDGDVGISDIIRKAAEIGMKPSTILNMIEQKGAAA